MAQESEHQRQTLLRDEWWAFVKSVARHGHAIVTLLSGWGILWIIEKLGYSLPPWIVPWVVAISVVVGAFVEWRIGRRAKEEAQEQAVIEKLNHSQSLSQMRLQYETNQSAWLEIFKPKLSIICGPDVRGSIVSYAGGYDFDSTFRAVVKASGLGTNLGSCRARLMEVGRNGSTIWSGEDMPLTFVLSGDRYATDKVLDPELPSYLEIVGVKAGKLKFAVNTNTRTLGEDTDAEIQRKGSYSIIIAFSAFNSVSIRSEFLLNWMGSFDGSSLTLIESRPLGITQPSSVQRK